MGEVTALKTAGEHSSASPPCHVRVTHGDRHGFIEFQFSMGDPGIYLEMTLPPAAFAEFCARHRAVPLSDAQARAVDAEARRWRYGHEDGD